MLLQADQNVRIHVVVICISPYHTVNLFKSVNTVNITFKPINNMLFVVLAVSVHAHIWFIRTRVYAKPDCMLIKHSSLCKAKCTSAVHVNQKCMRALRAKHDVHGSRITSCVYTREMCIDSYIIDLLCTPRLFVCIFRNMSSRVVATRVCSQVLIELYRMYSNVLMLR